MSFNRTIGTGFQEPEVEQTPLTPYSLAGELCQECVKTCKEILVLIRSPDGRPSSLYFQLRQGYETLVLWENSYGVTDHGLDEVLSKSRVARHSVLELLVDIGRILEESLFPHGYKTSL